MEDNLPGIIGAGVVCALLLLVIIAVACIMYYRCLGNSKDFKSVPEDQLTSVYTLNGRVSSMNKFTPYTISPPKFVHQGYKTSSSRHMATYRPRYIEEMNPSGIRHAGKPSVVMKAQTFNGPFVYPGGPVLYDITQPRAPRSQKVPFWADGQEEAVATMMLGEESPRGNDRKDIKSSFREQDHKFVKKGSDTGISSPIVTGYPEYIIVPDPELPKPPSSEVQLANGNIRNSQRSSKVGEEHIADLNIQLSDRQRTSKDGDASEPRVDSLPNKRPKTPTLRNDEAVYVSSGPTRPVQGENHSAGHYFFGQQHYLERLPVTEPQPEGFYVIDQHSDAQKFIARSYETIPPIESRENLELSRDNLRQHSSGGSQSEREQIPNVNSSSHAVVDLEEGSHVIKELHSRDDFRVIKSKRRPNWLKNAGAWFSKNKKSK